MPRSRRTLGAITAVVAAVAITFAGCGSGGGKSNTTSGGGGGSSPTSTDAGVVLAAVR